jgi:hypothetical protein
MRSVLYRLSYITHLWHDLLESNQRPPASYASTLSCRAVSASHTGIWSTYRNNRIGTHPASTSHIPVLRPSGQPAVVQNCSRQFCRTRKQLVLSQPGMPVPFRCALFGATHETRTRIFLVHSQGLYPVKLEPPLT